MSTCVNYWAYAHQTIRREMYDGEGPSSQGDARLGWHQLAERLSSVRDYVDAAIAGVQASQRGAAADAAIGAMTPLGAWVDETTLAGVAGAAPGVSTTSAAAAPAPTSSQGGTGIGGSEHAGVRVATGTTGGSGGFLSGGPVVTGPGDGATSRNSRGGTRGGFAPRGVGSPGGWLPLGVGSHRAMGGFGPAGSPEPAAARGIAAGVAGAGRPPVPGVSGTAGGAAPFGAVGGGKGSEDKERQRPSYLVESDSDRLIGDLPRTAPAVIGEDPPDGSGHHR